jgi:hypothetical protein
MKNKFPQWFWDYLAELIQRLWQQLPWMQLAQIACMALHYQVSTHLITHWVMPNNWRSILELSIESSKIEPMVQSFISNLGLSGVG